MSPEFQSTPAYASYLPHEVFGGKGVFIESVYSDEETSLSFLGSVASNKKIREVVKICGYDGPEEVLKSSLLSLEIDIDSLVQGIRGVLSESTVVSLQIRGALPRKYPFPHYCEVDPSTVERIIEGLEEDTLCPLKIFVGGYERSNDGIYAWANFKIIFGKKYKLFFCDKLP